MNLTGWRRLVGAPHAVLLSIWLWTLPIVVWVTYAFSPTPRREHVTAAVGVLAVGTTFAAGALIHRSRVPPGATEPISLRFAVVTATVAATIHGSVIALLPSLMGTGRTVNAPLPLGVSVMFVGAFGALVGVLVVRRHQRRYVALEFGLRRQQLAVLHEPEEALAWWRNHTLDAVRREVGSQLQRIRRVIGPGPADAALATRAAEQMQALVDDTVRPLSRRLTRGEELVPVDETGLDRGIEPPTWDDFAGESRRERLRIVAEDLTSSPLLVKLPTGVAISLLALVALADAVLLGIVATLLPGWPLSVPHTLVAVAVPTVAVIGMGLAVALVARRHRRALHRLRMVLDEIDREVRRLRTRVRGEQLSLARLVHREVQCLLTAASLQLGQPSAPHPRALIDAVRHRIDLVLSGSTDELLQVETVADLWKTIVAIDLAIDDDARALLDRDAGTKEQVTTVIAEAVANAARHGGASTVRIDVSLDHHLHIEVRDNGRHTTEPFRPGSGVRLFDQLTQRWQLTELGDGMLLDVAFTAPIDRSA